MWKYNGEVKVSEDEFKKLVEEGWTQLNGEFETTTPGNEIWRWRVIGKPVSKGPVDLRLQSVTWGTRVVIFFFKW
jgi:hypothetical protein